MKFWTRAELWRWCTVVFVGTTALYASRSALPVVSVLVRDEFEWDNNQLGKVLGSFSYGYMMSQIIGGCLADRFGGALVLTYCGAVWSVLTFFTPTIVRASSSPAAAMTTKRIALGVIQGLHYPAMTSLIAEKVRDGERSLPYSFVASGGQVGILLVGSLGSFISVQYSWDNLFQLIGLLSMIWVFFIYKMDKNYREGQLALKDNFEDCKEIHLPKPNLCKKAVAAMMFAHLTSNNCFFIMFNWLPAYFHSHWPDESPSLYSSIPWSLSLFGSLGSGYMCDLLSKKYNVTFARKLCCTICLGLSAISLIFLSQTTTFYAALFYACLACTAQSFSAGCLLVNPSDLHPQASGYLFGIMNTVGAIPGFVGVQAVGLALHSGYDWPYILKSIAAFNILGNIVYIGGGSGKRLL